MRCPGVTYNLRSLLMKTCLTLLALLGMLAACSDDKDHVMRGQIDTMNAAKQTTSQMNAITKMQEERARQIAGN